MHMGGDIKTFERLEFNIQLGQIVNFIKKNTAKNQKMASGSTPVKSVTKNVENDIPVKYCRVCGEVIVLHSGYFNILTEKSK